MTEQERIDLYTSIVPNERQLKIQQMKFYAFVHYSVNTFTNKEWGSGKESPSVFNPKNQNTDQWCEAIKAAGMKGVVLTCKHHDGFCLWPTKTTEHCIRNSPYKNGKGDVVREVADSCKKYGLKFGVYLSPWDRNSPLYSTDAYNDFYIEQLTELLTNYGEIFMLWLDGACGSSADGMPKQKYDFERIWSTAVKLQPNIVMSGCAPDVRWVGNESGKARESEWNVVPKFQYELQNIAANCQTDDDMKKFQKRCQDVMIKDMGSRKFLAGYDEFMWYPAEVDVSIRRGWFYSKNENRTVKSVKKLLNIYINSVGNNCTLLLNVPPTDKGVIHFKDVNRLKELGRKIREITEKPIIVQKLGMLGENDGYIDFEFDSVKKLKYVIISEDIKYSQRVEAFDIYIKKPNGKYKKAYSGTIIGSKKIAKLKSKKCIGARFVIRQSRSTPVIKEIGFYE